MGKRDVRDWFVAMRPWSFPASVMPLMVTVAYLYFCGVSQFETFHWGKTFLALFSMVLFHSAGNLLSDYRDFCKGVDREGIVCVQTLVSGYFKPQEIRIFGLVMLLGAVATGLILVYLCGSSLLLLGGMGFLTTYFYSFFKYRAWGDAVIFCNFSLIPIVGMSIVFVGKFVPEVLLLTLPIGLITVAILHINNTRDILPDGQAGILTFGMLLGKRISIFVYLLEIIAPYVFVLGFIGMGFLPWTAISVLLTLPIALGNSKMALCGLQEEGAIANLDQETAKLQLAFSLFFIVGLALSRLLV